MSFIPARQGRLVSLPSAPVAPAPAEPAIPAPDQAAEPRARIVAALHRRGEGGESGESGEWGAAPLHHPADGPPPPAGEDVSATDLPALAADLPADSGSGPGAGDTRAPQERFTRELQREFLEALSIVGSVRDAARRVGVSHMSAYRARRKCAAFRQCWEAALVLAIPHAEEELTCRAIDGVEEDVMYRGEVVHTRIRKDARLLLAHLGRLDRKAAQPQAAALAECFDDALDALGRGDQLPETAPAVPTPVSPSEQCNRCNTSSAQEGPDRTEQGAAHGAAQGVDLPARQPFDPLLDAMERERPFDAPLPELLGDYDAVIECQKTAFEARDAEWWCYGEGFVFHHRDALGRWVPEEELADVAAEQSGP